MICVFLFPVTSVWKAILHNLPLLQYKAKHYGLSKKKWCQITLRLLRKAVACSSFPLMMKVIIPGHPVHCLFITSYWGWEGKPVSKQKTGKTSQSSNSVAAIYSTEHVQTGFGFACHAGVDIRAPVVLWEPSSVQHCTTRGVGCHVMTGEYQDFTGKDHTLHAGICLQEPGSSHGIFKMPLHPQVKCL